jgi:uncharacterized protein (TIGR03083 family)
MRIHRALEVVQEAIARRRKRRHAAYLAQDEAGRTRWDRDRQRRIAAVLVASRSNFLSGYPSLVESNEYLEAIERESAAIAVALKSGRSLAVPSCPGWRVADLVVHLGIIQRWATEMVRSGAAERLGGREELFAIDPDDPALLEWFRDGARDLVEVLRSSPADAPVWSWTPERSVGFWERRQAHEAAVHRWDAQRALGAAEPIDPALAADGVDEWLYVFAVGRSRATSPRTGIGESFHLHCTDEQGEWVVRFDGDGMEVKREHAKAAVAVRGPASDLLLFVWGRQSVGGLEVLGDSSMLERWNELLPAV